MPPTWTLTDCVLDLAEAAFAHLDETGDDPHVHAAACYLNDWAIGLWRQNMRAWARSL